MILSPLNRPYHSLLWRLAGSKLTAGISRQRAWLRRFGDLLGRERRVRGGRRRRNGWGGQQFAFQGEDPVDDFPVDAQPAQVTLVVKDLKGRAVPGYDLDLV